MRRSREEAAEEFANEIAEERYEYAMRYRSCPECGVYGGEHHTSCPNRPDDEPTEEETEETEENEE